MSVRLALALRLASLVASATLAAACYRGSVDNQSNTAADSAVAVVNTETPEKATPPEVSEAVPSEPAPVVEPISLEPPPDVAEPPPDAERGELGFASKVLKAGTGTVKPSMLDQVVVHYAGWTRDGKLFDSSIQRNAPSTLGVRQVIAGWVMGLKLMVVGERRRFWIPADLAYGDSPRHGGAPAGALVFDIELLGIK